MVIFVLSVVDFPGPILLWGLSQMGEAITTAWCQDRLKLEVDKRDAEIAQLKHRLEEQDMAAWARAA